MQKVISVIVPVYNAEKFLERSLTSIIKQTYKQLEIILINDGSTDNSLEILKQFKNNDSRIKVINQKNSGVGAARNTGLDIAKGEFISFIDADDIIENNFFESLIGNMLKFNCDVVASNIRVLAGDFSFKPYEIYGNKLLTNNIDILKSYLTFNISTAVWGKLFRKSLIANIRFPEINLNEDFIFQWEIIKHVNSFFQDNETNYNYILGNTKSLTNRGFGKDNIMLFKHAVLVEEYIRNNYQYLEQYGIAYFRACILHNLVLYYNNLQNENNHELFHKEVLLMAKALKGIDKLDICLLEPEKNINVSELILGIESCIDRKLGGTK